MIGCCQDDVTLSMKRAGVWSTGTKQRGNQILWGMPGRSAGGKKMCQNLITGGCCFLPAVPCVSPNPVTNPFWVTAQDALGWGGKGSWRCIPGTDIPHSSTADIHRFLRFLGSYWWDIGVSCWLALKPWAARECPGKFPSEIVQISLWWIIFEVWKQTLVNGEALLLLFFQCCYYIANVIAVCHYSLEPTLGTKQTQTVVV